jgi:phage FluMu gp28-like protein
MRTMSITHGGETYELAATFKASLEIADKVEDPLTIAREAALELAMMKVRMPYQPKFRFTVRNVPMILHAGLKAAGSTMLLSEVEELVFDRGLVHARLWAADYLALIVEPKPFKPEVEPEDEHEPEETPGNA